MMGKINPKWILFFPLFFSFFFYLKKIVEGECDG